MVGFTSTGFILIALRYVLLYLLTHLIIEMYSMQSEGKFVNDFIDLL